MEDPPKTIYQDDAVAQRKSKERKKRTQKKHASSKFHAENIVGKWRNITNRPRDEGSGFFSYMINFAEDIVKYYSQRSIVVSSQLHNSTRIMACAALLYRLAKRRKACESLTVLDNKTLHEEVGRVEASQALRVWVRVASLRSTEQLGLTYSLSFAFYVVRRVIDDEDEKSNKGNDGVHDDDDEEEDVYDKYFDLWDEILDILYNNQPRLGGKDVFVLMSYSILSYPLLDELISVTKTANQEAGATSFLTSAFYEQMRLLGVALSSEKESDGGAVAKTSKLDISVIGTQVDYIYHTFEARAEETRNEAPRIRLRTRDSSRSVMYISGSDARTLILNGNNIFPTEYAILSKSLMGKKRESEILREKKRKAEEGSVGNVPQSRKIM